MRNDFLVFAAPLIEEDEINEVVDCLRSGWIGTGPRVARFEHDFRVYKGNWGYPVAMNSCTAALHISLLAAGLQPGDEVITTPLTFCATVNAIIHAGLVPRLADVDPVTMNIDPLAIERAITPKTRAVVIVHFAGRPCEMSAIIDITKSHGLKLIEDCAHAIETEYHGQRAGTMGDFGCFSFYVTKNVITGEGGMVLARTEAEAKTCKRLALHGMSQDAWKRFGDDGYKHYHVVDCGFKYNMMDLQAALGLKQLEKVERHWHRRATLWQMYEEGLRDLPLVLPPAPAAGTRHAYHLFTILIDTDRCGISRDDFLNEITKLKIGVGVHYLSIPEHPVYQRKYGWHPADVPNASRIGQQTVSLPLSPKLSDSDVRDVIEAVREVLTQAARRKFDSSPST